MGSPRSRFCPPSPSGRGTNAQPVRQAAVSKRNVSGRHTRPGMRRSNRRSSVGTSPSHTAAIGVDTCSNGQPDKRDRLRDHRVASLHADDLKVAQYVLLQSGEFDVGTWHGC